MTSGSRFTKPVVTYTRNTNLTIRCGTTLLILVKTPGRESDGIPDTRKLAAKQRYRERLTFVWYWGTRGAACGTGEHVVQLVVLGNTWCSLWYWGTRGAACGTGEHVVQLVVLGNTWCSLWYWGTRGAACGTGEHVVQLVVLGNTWCSLWYWGTRGAACGTGEHVVQLVVLGNTWCSLLHPVLCLPAPYRYTRSSLVTGTFKSLRSLVVDL